MSKETKPNSKPIKFTTSVLHERSASRCGLSFRNLTMTQILCEDGSIWSKIEDENWKCILEAGYDKKEPEPKLVCFKCQEEKTPLVDYYSHAACVECAQEMKNVELGVIYTKSEYCEEPEKSLQDKKCKCDPTTAQSCYICFPF